MTVFVWLFCKCCCMSFFLSGRGKYSWYPDSFAWLLRDSRQNFVLWLESIVHYVLKVLLYLVYMPDNVHMVIQYSCHIMLNLISSFEISPIFLLLSITLLMDGMHTMPCWEWLSHQGHVYHATDIIFVKQFISHYACDHVYAFWQVSKAGVIGLKYKCIVLFLMTFEWLIRIKAFCTSIFFLNIDQVMSRLIHQNLEIKSEVCCCNVLQFLDTAW